MIFDFHLAAARAPIKLWARAASENGLANPDKPAEDSQAAPSWGGWGPNWRSLRVLDPQRWAHMFSSMLKDGYHLTNRESLQASASVGNFEVSNRGGRRCGGVVSSCLVQFRLIFGYLLLHQPKGTCTPVHRPERLDLSLSCCVTMFDLMSLDLSCLFIKCNRVSM
jgi:hypothetical protein